jgi:hypothetical protein
MQHGLDGALDGGDDGGSRKGTRLARMIGNVARNIDDGQSGGEGCQCFGGHDCCDVGCDAEAFGPCTKEGGVGVDRKGRE